MARAEPFDVTAAALPWLWQVLRVLGQKRTGRKRPIADAQGKRHRFDMIAEFKLWPYSCLAISATALILSGCANPQQQVAGHQYEVPDANLISKSDYPFFLPESENEAFIFILNPEAELREQRTVLVEGRDDVCARANGAGYVSQTICGSQEVVWKDQRWRKTGDDTFWNYSLDTPEAPKAPLVSCHKMEVEGHSGLCHATLSLGDLALTISLNDDELPEIETTYERAATMLRSWEV